MSSLERQGHQRNWLCVCNQLLTLYWVQQYLFLGSLTWLSNFQSLVIMMICLQPLYSVVLIEAEKLTTVNFCYKNVFALWSSNHPCKFFIFSYQQWGIPHKNNSSWKACKSSILWWQAKPLFTIISSCTNTFICHTRHRYNYWPIKIKRTCKTLHENESDLLTGDLKGCLNLELLL